VRIVRRYISDEVLKIELEITVLHVTTSEENI
jgi:hypothetical protein